MMSFTLKLGNRRAAHPGCSGPQAKSILAEDDWKGRGRRAVEPQAVKQPRAEASRGGERCNFTKRSRHSIGDECHVVTVVCPGHKNVCTDSKFNDTTQHP